MLNIGLHCVISALMIDVFAILIAGLACDGKAKRLTHLPKASVLAALFFAAHPIHTESVSKEDDMTQRDSSSSKQTCYNCSAALTLYKAYIKKPYSVGVRLDQSAQLMAAR